MKAIQAEMLHTIIDHVVLNSKERWVFEDEMKKIFERFGSDFYVEDGKWTLCEEKPESEIVKEIFDD